MSSDYYGLLGITHTATQDEIKKQYKKLAIKYHPDKTQDKEHHQKFLLIREAYDTLKDEDLRQKYNREKGIGVMLRPSPNYPAPRGYNYGTDFSSYSRYQQTRTPFGSSGFGSTFFDMYLRTTKMHSDYTSRAAQREEAQKKEEQDAFYTEYTHKKMQEDKERRQEEYIRRARKQREEEELRQKMEESMRRQKEEKMRPKDEYAKSRGFGDAKSEYEYAKQEAHRRARQQEAGRAYGYGGFTHRDEEPAEFIVVEDEEPEQDLVLEEEGGSNDDSENSEDFHSGYESAPRFGGVKNETYPGFQTTTKPHGNIFVEQDEESNRTANLDNEGATLMNNEHVEGALEEDQPQEEEEEESTTGVDPESVPPTENADDYTNASFASEGTEYATPSASRHKPEIVEVPEESDYDVTGTYFRKSSNTKTSPSRPQSQTGFHSYACDFDERLKDSRTGTKKPKLGNYDGMRKSLHTYFEDVDFEDIRSTLPDYATRTRKASVSSAAQTSKRPRYAEYTNGTSKAETLYTPVNKTYSRKSTGTISIADLSPTVEDSSLLFSEELPSLKVHQDMTKAEWDTYVEKIHAYERKFALYRKAVLEYQMGRLGKDERHHNIIYSDTSCLDIYLKCLFNDALLLQNYTRALQEFRQTLQEFRVNCDTVDNMKA